MANNHKPQLARQLDLSSLVATGVCSMLGASIYVVPFMIQKHVPAIGPNVLLAFVIAAVPAIMAAVAYSALASAMPNAGGSYVYASRGLHPYLGFVASFSQWFGLSIVIGVVAYVTVPFIRDLLLAMGFQGAAALLDTGAVRIAMALALVWTFVWVNIRGAATYKSTILPMMALMFALGAMVIVAGFYFNQADFAEALALQGKSLAPQPQQGWDFATILSASALLFASYIGFDSIAQAGGEAKDPTRTLPAAIAITIAVVGGYYMLFTSAVYHTVPWWHVAELAAQQDVTAPGLLAPLLPAWLTAAIVAGAAIALVNDLPAMLLSVSRLMFAWSVDGIFPAKVSSLHTKHRTPAVALVLSAIMASVGILGSHFAGSFFLGIDIMVTSMMVNFLLMCLTISVVDFRNPEVASRISVIKTKLMRRVIGFTGVAILLLFLAIHLHKELTSELSAWYFHSTYIWLIVMAIGTTIYLFYRSKMQSKDIFDNLPGQQ